MAGCLPISRTMSDGEGPSAGEWQRYIYPPRLRLQSQGHWSPRTRPPHPPTAGCRQLWGWTPWLKPDAWGAGGYVSGGRCVTLKAQQCRTPASPWGESRKRFLPRTLPAVIWAMELTHPRLPLDPGWAQGVGSWNRVQTSVCKHLLGDGGQGSAQLPLDLPEV